LDQPKKDRIVGGTSFTRMKEKEVKAGANGRDWATELTSFRSQNQRLNASIRK
jgi:hypothetical protein